MFPIYNSELMSLDIFSMGILGKSCMVGVVVFAVIVAYYLNNPIPPNTGNSFKYTTVMGMFKLMKHIVSMTIHYSLHCSIYFLSTDERSYLA